MSELKKEKFYTHIDRIMKQEKKGELVDLTAIYEDHDSPPYKSPKRVLHYPTGKFHIECEITDHNMEIEKVIRYERGRIFGNFELALYYLCRLDSYYRRMIVKLLYMQNPNIIEDFRQFQENLLKNN